MGNNLKKFQTILSGRNNVLANTVRHCQQLAQLEKQLRAKLSNDIASQHYWRLGSLSGGKLVLLTDSALWASKLRLQQGSFVNAVRQLQNTAVTVEIKIAQQHVQLTTKAKQKQSRVLAKQSAEVIAGFADNLPADDELKQSLLRLLQCKK